MEPPCIRALAASIIATTQSIKSSKTRRPSHRLVTDSFDVVLIGIEKERAIIVAVVARAKPRPAIIYSSGGEAGAMESVNFVARRGG